MRWWLNGEQTEWLPLADRGLAYGDGLFSTIAAKGGVPALLDAHMARLERGCARLQIAPIDWPALRRELAQRLSEQAQPAVIKVIVTRGSGGRGYSPQGADHPTVAVGVGPWPEHYFSWRRDGIPLEICSLRLGLNPLTAGMKHLNRLEQVLIKQELDRHGWIDAVVCDIEGSPVETSASNLFWRKGERLYTPSVAQAGVAGVMRDAVCRWADQWGWGCQVGRFPLEALQAADEIFITNALMGVVPVTTLAGQTGYATKAARILQQQLYSDA